MIRRHCGVEGSGCTIGEQLGLALPSARVPYGKTSTGGWEGGGKVGGLEDQK